MSSPEANNGGSQDTKITFKFCRECSNMLYPSEDRQNNKLYFACRTCAYSEPPETACIYRNDLSNTVGDTAGITQDIGADPTVSSAFFPELCTMCGQEIICDTCGKPNAQGVWLEVNDKDEETSVDGDHSIDYNGIDFYDESMLSDPPSDDDHGEYYTAKPTAFHRGHADDEKKENKRPDQDEQSQRS